MKIYNYIIFILISILLLSPIVSALETQYTSESASVTVSIWPLVSLGIEKMGSVTTDQAKFYYNWISMGILFLLGAMSSKRMTRFFAILIPIFAGMMVYTGWMTSPNPAMTIGTICMCAILGVVTYMKGSLRENFGGGGPGNLIINLVYYLILLQSCVGLVNATEMWTHNADQSNMADASNLPQSVENAKNARLDSSIKSTTDSGGYLTGLVAAVSTLVDMVISVVKLLMSIVISLGAFTFVINTIFPFIGATPLGAAMLVLIQLGIYLMYVLFFVAMFGNKPADSTAF